MLEMTFQLGYLILMALFIAGCWWGTLRLLDKTVQVSFRRDVFPIMQQNPVGLAIYMGCRLLALALLYSPLLRVLF